MDSLIYLPVHVKEISAISDQFERFELFHLLKETGKFISPDKQRERKRAEELVAFGLGPAYASHLAFAFADSAGADFITCDDRLARHK